MGLDILGLLFYTQRWSVLFHEKVKRVQRVMRSPLDSLEWPIPPSVAGASYVSRRDRVGSELLSSCSIWESGSCLTRMLTVE